MDVAVTNHQPFAALIGPSVEASFWLVIRLRFV